MITDSPYIFFLALFVFSTTLAACFGYRLAQWRIRVLQLRIETLKLSIDIMRGSYGKRLR